MLRLRRWLRLLVRAAAAAVLEVAGAAAVVAPLKGAGLELVPVVHLLSVAAVLVATTTAGSSNSSPNRRARVSVQAPGSQPVLVALILM